MYTASAHDIKIKIAGVDVSAYIPKSDSERGLPGVQIEQIIGKDIDTASFAIEDGAALSISELDTVYITNTGETVKYFGGIITNIITFPVGPEVDLIITALDFTVLLEKTRINQEWENIVDTTILSNIASNSDPALSDFDFSTEVVSVGTPDKIRFSRMTVRDALDELAKRVGATWYIDYDKNLHWFATEENSAPLLLSNNIDPANNIYPYQNFEQVIDATDIVNRVLVVGGDYLSDDITHVFAGDGQQILFNLPHFYQAQSTGSIEIDKNTGTDVSPTWTSQTVGIKYIDDNADPAKDVLISYREKFVEFASAPSNLVSSWRIKARYEIPLRVRVSSAESYNRYGRWFESIIDDQTITSKVEGQQAGKALMAEKALGRTVFTLTTNEPGIRAGQVLELENTTVGIDAQYLVQSVTTTFVGGGLALFEISLGDYIPDLYAMMLQIAKRAAGKVEWRDDEVLDEFLEAFEVLPLAEATTIVDTQPPYKYQNLITDSGAFAWGFGKYTT